MNFLPKIDIQNGYKLAFNIEKLLENLAKKNDLPDFEEKICLISDKIIWRKCAKFFDNQFKYKINDFLILDNPQANKRNLDKIEKIAKKNKLIIAVGSGTINDLCKFVSFKTQIPYIVFPSAPSMNGYASRNASLLIREHKKTVGATLPLAIYADLEILKTAPKEMIQAGIGDSLCFYSCWFDWLLSHLIFNTKFDAKPFKILQDKIDFFINNYKKFNLRDEKLLEILIEILLLSGAGMTMAQGSYPASQSEHLIAHAFEMRKKFLSAKNDENYYQKLHGLQIAITTLTTLEIQKNLIAANKIMIKNEKFPAKKIEKLFGKKISNECRKEYHQKLEIIKESEILSEEKWQKIHKKLQEVLFEKENLIKIFEHFKINISYKKLGLKKAEYEDLVGSARFIRNRITCLDLFG